ncbi:MAG: COX15/CtaA family protein [Acidobacteriaceae bacterium]|nr:COX15/CtaA family protein [Acidobacteriaceae bacterium]MBV9781870.1 COX15/CtaA family protein [Acidobacteriaceae bacterium]
MHRELSSAHRRFSLLAWGVLAYNIPVILWGAYVRATFSGNGCGAHWPFCSGEIVPQNMSVPTSIEFTHRLMTGLDSIAVVVMCLWALRIFPRGHKVRLLASLSLVFLLVEAALGAGLVLFRFVARDQSAGRALYLSAHLTNTLLLLGALTATAWLSSRNQTRLEFAHLSRTAFAALPVTVFIGITGAIAALGDTLFPASSLAAGMQEDFSSASNLLMRLRLVHPVIAVAGAAYLIWAGAGILKRVENGTARTAAARVLGLTIFQLAAGMVNLTLLAPIWMQLFHLFMADLVWIAVVLLVLETGLPDAHFSPARKYNYASQAILPPE